MMVKIGMIFHSQLIWESHNPFMFQTTNQGLRVSYQDAPVCQSANLVALSMISRATSSANLGFTQSLDGHSSSIEREQLRVDWDTTSQHIHCYDKLGEHLRVSNWVPSRKRIWDRMIHVFCDIKSVSISDMQSVGSQYPKTDGWLMKNAKMDDDLGVPIF